MSEQAEGGNDDVEMLRGRVVRVVLKTDAPGFNWFQGVLAASDERGVYLTNEANGENSALILIVWAHIAYMGELDWFRSKKAS